MKYPYPIASMLINIVAGIVYPALFIWAVNTLFGAGIPFRFKTWLASLLMFLTLRFFINKSYYPAPDYDDYDDEYDDDEDDDEYDEEEDDDEDDEDDNDPPPYRPRRGRMRRVK